MYELNGQPVARNFFLSCRLGSGAYEERAAEEDGEGNLRVSAAAVAGQRRYLLP